MDSILFTALTGEIPPHLPYPATNSSIPLSTPVKEEISSLYPAPEPK